MPDRKSLDFAGFVVLGILFVAFPRFATVIAGGAVLVLAALGAVSGRLDLRAIGAWLKEPARRALLVPFAAFTCWSLVSALWAESPVDGTVKGLLTAAVLAAALVISYFIDGAGRDQLERVLTGLTVGLLTASVYLLLETVTERGLANFLFKEFPMLQSGYEKHLKISRKGIVQVSDANLNRSTGLYCLLLWPAILVGLQQASGRLRTLLTGGLVFSAVVLLVTSRHQSSQLGLLASGAAFGLAIVSADAARRLIAATLVGIMVLIVPVSLAAYKYGLHEAPWLFSTARQRVLIWNYTAEQILKAPVFGVGIDSTHKRSQEFKETHASVSRTSPPPEWRPHPHNVYLQVWYELGGIGTVLFAWAGLAAIWASRQLPQRLAPYALAQAAMTFGMIAASYGLWQTWFQASVAIGALAVYGAARLASADPASPRPGEAGPGAGGARSV